MQQLKTRLMLLLLLLISLVIITSYPYTPEDDEQLNIYTSIYPIQYITQEIIGDGALVQSVYPPGVDAHTYEPSIRDLTSIANSDGFIYLGGGMESFAETVVDALHSYDTPFIELGKNSELFHINEEHDDDHGHDHGDYDPHIWLDPLRMITMAEMIYGELVDIYPDQKNIYKENLNHLKERLLQLDQAFMDTLQPKENKHILVAHAAYGYWEERYGIKQIPISGLTHGSEPSQKDLVKIIETAKDKQLSYVIFEQNSSDRVSEIIQKFIDAKAVEIHNLETLTDNDIRDGADYFSIMMQNLSVLDKVTK